MYDKALLFLCDSAFPTGSFAHSQGLEYAVQAAWVRDAASFQEWGRAAIQHSFLSVEGRACALAWRYERCASLSKLGELNQQCYALRLGAEQRHAQAQQARSLRRAALGILGRAAQSLEWVGEGLFAPQESGAEPQLAVVWGSVCAWLGIPGQESCLALLANTVKQMAYVLIRVVPLGQTEALAAAYEIVQESQSALEQMCQTCEDCEDSKDSAPVPLLESFFPYGELACLGQARMHARYFKS